MGIDLDMSGPAVRRQVGREALVEGREASWHACQERRDVDGRRLVDEVDRVRGQRRRRQQPQRLGAELDERRWTRDDRPPDPGCAKRLGDDLAHRQRLGTAELERLGGRRGIGQAVGGETRDVVDEHRRQELPAEVGHGNRLEQAGEPDEPIEGDVPRSVDPGRADDRVLDRAGANRRLGPPLRPEPVARVGRGARAGQVDQPADTGTHGRRHQALGPRRVHVHERAAQPRRLDRRVGERERDHETVETLDRTRQPVARGDIRVAKLNLIRELASSGLASVAEDDDPVAAPVQLGGDGATDEARATGDADRHRVV
jgi:hypothetical protein